MLKRLDSSRERDDLRWALGQAIYDKHDWKYDTLGRVIHHRLKDQRFLVYVHVSLILVGVTLLGQAVWHQVRAAP